MAKVATQSVVPWTLDLLVVASNEEGTSYAQTVRRRNDSMVEGETEKSRWPKANGLSSRFQPKWLRMTMVMMMMMMMRTMMIHMILTF